MIEFSVVFIAGLLGSFHCLGMCGPIAISLGASGLHGSNFRRQLIFSSGRIFTYSVMGVFAAFLGNRLGQRLGGWINVSAVLAVVAGVLLCLQGLLLLGVFRRRRAGNNANCMAASLFAGFLASPGVSGVFLAGLFTGMLPCGLVYGMLALAGSSQNLWVGPVTMAVFGLGTMPMMVLAGLGGAMITYRFRAHVLRFAACTVILAGTLSIVRGFGFFHFGGVFDPADCPLCR